MGYIILLCVLLCALILCIYILHRNERVYEFTGRVAIAEYYYNKDRISRGYFRVDYPISDKHSYERMLYSIKPLTFESWFTKEECEILYKFDKTQPLCQDFENAKK